MCASVRSIGTNRVIIEQHYLISHFMATIMSEIHYTARSISIRAARIGAAAPFIAVDMASGHFGQINNNRLVSIVHAASAAVRCAAIKAGHQASGPLATL